MCDESVVANRRRARLFWLACIPVRASFAAAALLIPLYMTPRLLILVGAAAALAAIGFWSNVIRAARGEHTGCGIFGGRVWWERVRVVHAALWTIASTAAFAQAPWAGWVLVADVSVGALAGASHYVQNTISTS